MQWRRIAILALSVAAFAAAGAPRAAQAQLRMLGVEMPWERERAEPKPQHFLETPRSWHSGAITYKVDGRTPESAFGTRAVYLRGPEKRIVTHLRPALEPWVPEKRAFEIHTREWIYRWREGEPNGVKLANPYRLVDARIARMAPDEQAVFRENAARLVAETRWHAPGPQAGTDTILDMPCDVFEGPEFRSWVWRDQGIELKRLYKSGDLIEAIRIDKNVATQDVLFQPPMSMRFPETSEASEEAAAAAVRLFDAVVEGRPVGPEPLLGAFGL